ncbi:metallopeptidase TldD-related protein [Candidatus Phytoplasma pini]|uniref:Metalloprotease TldD/E C-terminal domain-containing protein n=1 Tax=Candidatus Phytoplasma pini TaxID=267362 RepID=A0A559KJS2_9MOLU|nr:metallopeptidase TldD-related protein [Candidatus Phytoplasma pini]TVY12382.1 hypothetical protein MDPP_00156 [Candidatus Phytoplasma pini]
MQNYINYKKWFQKSLQYNFDSLEIIFNEKQSLNITLEDTNISKHTKSDLILFTIKGLYKNKKSVISLEKINDNMIDDVLQILKNKTEILTSKEKDFIFEGSLVYPSIRQDNFDFTQIDLKEKYNLLFALKEKLFESSYLKIIDSIDYYEKSFKHHLVNSKGLILEESGSFAAIYATCVFQKDNDITEITKVLAVKKFENFDISKFAKEIVNLGERKVGAKSLISQTYSVVFSNEIFADLLEIFSNIFNGMRAYRGLTKLKDQEGKQIASTKVTLIDDPLSEEAFSQHRFDDEGVACYTKSIVEKGFFKQFVHNLKTAHIFQTKPTGNGFDDSISMGNFYLKKGDKSLEEIISPINNGVYIDYLIGLHAGVNDINGDFSIQAGGFRIEKGIITTPVKLIVVSGNFLDILQNIKAIANDFIFQTSGFGSASVYVGELSIAGEY